MTNKVKVAVFGLLGLLAACSEDAAPVAPAFTQNPATVFINEIHYDNAGTDAGEAVEIAGPAGTNLSGWDIVPYNGNGGAPYNPTTPLVGTIPDQGSGYGTVSVLITGLQNGSPDGLALVNTANEVVQFLSYEGAFAALGGLANGLASTNIGVTEPDTTPAGFSLQLKGTGATYQDFTWTAASDDSFSAVNAGQTFSGVPPQDVAPTALSTTPINGATGVALDSSIAITFSEPVTVAEGGLTLECSISGVRTDFTVTPSGDATVYTFDPAQNFARAETCTVTLAAEAVTDRDGAPNTLAAPYSFAFTTLGAVTKISAVQGSTDSSPLVGQTVTVEGVVAGDFEGASPALRGFYVQEEAADQDTDPATSEGIFVFNGDLNSVSVGQTVSVTGRVGEFGGQTQLTPSTAEVLASGTVPAPLELTLPVPAPVNGVPYLERFEGMLVTLSQSLAIAEYFNYDRFGEVVLAQPPTGLERPYTPTSYLEPGSPAAAEAAELNLRSRITLDDASTAQNPEVTRHPNAQPFSLTNRFRGGDTVTDTTGILAYGFGLYRVQPTQGAEYAVQNPRTAAPDPVGGSLKVASFNVLNYFTTLTSQDSNARGADTPEEFERQQAKIVAALKAIDADIFGLIEIENNGDTAVASLVDALNVAVGAGTYTYVPTGVIGTDAIKVALIYKPETVTPKGDFAVLNTEDDSRFIDTSNRPVLIQTFADNAGGVFTVAVNHLKSKGSDCNELGDPDTGDGQGNCNVTRTQAAAALVDHLATDPTGSGDTDFLIVGDLNSYDEEDPIRTLGAAGYTDLNERFGGEFAYSYAFDGQLGYLDYALSSPTLTGQVTGTTEWHISADEPDLLDYDMSFKSAGQDVIYAPDPYRASDHDPVVVGLSLEAPDPAVLLDELTALIRGLGLGRGDEQKLLAQLETAERHLAGGRTAQADDALGRFETQVGNLVRKGLLTADEGETLLDASQAIRDLL